MASSVQHSVTYKPTSAAKYPAYTLVAEKIYQVRLSLPFALNHVNCYLLQDDDGWTVVDAGLNRPECREQWLHVFEDLEIRAGQIRQIILTHMHPDHFGLAGWLQELTDAPVYLSAVEADLAHRVWIENVWRTAESDEYWRRTAGLPHRMTTLLEEQTDSMRSMTFPHPTVLEIIVPDQMVEMGGRTFQAIHTPGHSDGHLSFYSRADGLMLSGDQVLMKITPNIGLWPTSEPDPLGRYLHSLRDLAALEVAQALPGHGVQIYQWQQRIEELLHHHDLRLDKMCNIIEQASSTALQVSQQVFNFSRLSQHEVRFAVAETLAHLDYLARQERLQFSENGMRIYQRIET